MAINCDPSICPDQWFRHEESFRLAVLKILGSIVNGGIAPPVPTQEATFDAIGGLRADLIGAGHTQAYDLGGGLLDPAKAITINNKTNGDVYVSMDGGVSDNFMLSAHESLHINLAALGVIATGQIHLRQGPIPPDDLNYVYIYVVR